MLPVFVFAFVVVSKLYPLKVMCRLVIVYLIYLQNLFRNTFLFFNQQEALTDEFYSERSLLYRLYYMNINFFIFRMRMYTGILLSESVCIAAGLGAYPVWSKARLGTGPTERHEDIAILLVCALLHSVSFEGYIFYLVCSTLELHVIMTCTTCNRQGYSQTRLGAFCLSVGVIRLSLVAYFSLAGCCL